MTLYQLIGAVDDTVKIKVVDRHGDTLYDGAPSGLRERYAVLGKSIIRLVVDGKQYIVEV